MLLNNWRMHINLGLITTEEYDSILEEMGYNIWTGVYSTESLAVAQDALNENLS